MQFALCYPFAGALPFPVECMRESTGELGWAAFGRVHSPCRCFMRVPPEGSSKRTRPRGHGVLFALPGLEGGGVSQRPGRSSPAFLSHLRQRSWTLRCLPTTPDPKASLSASKTRLRCNLPKSRLGRKDSRPSGIWERGPQDAPLGAWGSEAGHQGSVIKAVNMEGDGSRIRQRHSRKHGDTSTSASSRLKREGPGLYAPSPRRRWVRTALCWGC